ncbi:MAG: cation-transporting P-type ATPase, partial [Actinomycetota bacterium]|nr:cation-transporting P-type ATPase [Actinomycetota bacterium]
MSVPAAARTAQAASLRLSDAAGQPIAEVYEHLASSNSGLTEAEAAARLARLGPNVLPSRPVTVHGILLGQLRNPLLVLLLAAAVVSAFTGGLTDAAIIVAIM